MAWCPGWERRMIGPCLSGRSLMDLGPQGVVGVWGSLFRAMEHGDESTLWLLP